MVLNKCVSHNDVVKLLTCFTIVFFFNFIVNMNYTFLAINLYEILNVVNLTSGNGKLLVPRSCGRRFKSRLGLFGF